MQTLKFKTSLKCNGCVNAIKPSMDKIKGIKAWRVFLDIEEKTLEIDLDDSNSEQITDAVTYAVINAGYNIERI